MPNSRIKTIDQFAVEVDTAIQQGKVPPKSKIPELVPRVATVLHVFNHTMNELLSGVPATAPPTEISNTTLLLTHKLEHVNRLHDSIKTMRISRSLSVSKE